jgi:hypothetical protein
MNIKVHLLGALVDYLPDSDRGQTVLSLEDKRIEVLQIAPAGEKNGVLCRSHQHEQPSQRTHRHGCRDGIEEP